CARVPRARGWRDFLWRSSVGDTSAEPQCESTGQRIACCCLEGPAGVLGWSGVPKGRNMWVPGTLCCHPLREGTGNPISGELRSQKRETRPPTLQRGSPSEGWPPSAVTAKM
uniref:Uncharacterized protein n=1 Tax=Mustela putorius furo TaxID=9669 RepID=M3XW70_MUSPF